MVTSSIPRNKPDFGLGGQHAPALWPVLSFSIGLALTRTDLLPLLPAALLWLSLLLVLILRGSRGLAAMLAVGAAMGFLSLWTDAQMARVEPSWLKGEQLITANVMRVQSMGVASRLRLKDIARQDGRKLPGLADVYAYGLRGRIWPGAHVRLRVRFHLPDNHRNPGAFDYRAWCFDHHLALAGSAIGDVTIISQRMTLFASWRERIRKALTDVPASGVIAALLMADRQHVPEDWNLAFSATGTAHLLAISGLHLGMVGMLAYLAVWWLLTRRESWIVSLPVRPLAWTAALLMALAYAHLAGWPLPARRAAMMMTAGVLAWWFSARVSPMQVLMLALALILVLDPPAIASASLWLSFLATAAIVLFSRRSHRRSWLQRIGMLANVSLLAWLATLPIVVDLFGRLPLWALPVNLLLVPFYGFWVMPWALAGALASILDWPQLAHAAMQLAGLGIEASARMLLIVQRLPGGDVVTVDVPLGNQLLYALLVALGCLVFWRRRQGAGVALIGAAVALLTFSALHEARLGSWQWVTWDVGQGAASSIMAPDGAVLCLDVPGRRGSRFNGGYMVSEGLRSLGHRHLDVLLISHAQQDHIGGALSLVRRMGGVRELWLPVSARKAEAARPLLHWAAEQSVAVRWLKRGDRIRWHGAQVRVLWPEPAENESNGNNASLVVRLQMPDGPALLFPGDIERSSERQLVQRGVHPVWGMLIPHHGSRTSSSPAFVRALQPDLAIAQTGRGNRYGFPDADVVARYREQGASVWNTADGALLVNWQEDLAKAHIRSWPESFSVRRRLALQWAAGAL
ncbi:MAG: DNA internalization-related competence protein ComEC/Rec2 [Zetaproteobacteria bacterium]|nr:MAG: DNA internalization-related competence protein ComEC/Rec2 [Zetaproteobacteria bacterium]